MKNLVALLVFLSSMSVFANPASSINCLDSKTSGDLQIFLQATASPQGFSYTWGLMKSGRQDGHLIIDRVENGTIYLSDHYSNGVPNLVLVPTAQHGLYNGFVTGTLFGSRQMPLNKYSIGCSLQ